MSKDINFQVGIFYDFTFLKYLYLYAVFLNINNVKH